MAYCYKDLKEMRNIKDLSVGLLEKELHLQCFIFNNYIQENKKMKNKGTFMAKLLNFSKSLTQYKKKKKMQYNKFGSE